MAASKTYIVEPVNSKPYEVKADSYTYDAQTGRHILKSGDEIVANLINVSVRLK